MAPSLFTCCVDGCGKEFTKKAKLDRHIASHTGDRQFKCEECDRSYLRKDHLTRHMISHQEDSKPFHCDVCGKRFSNRSHLARHMKRHQEPENYRLKCVFEGCDAAFKKKSQLRAHVEEQHGGDGSKPYRCSKEGCGRSFSTQSKLKYHDMACHQDCFVCGHPDCSDESNVFDSKDALNAHYDEVHATERVVCQECNRSFKNQQSYKDHCRRYHRPGVCREHLCDVCQKNYSSSTALALHKKMVHKIGCDDAEENKCEHCKKNFATKGSLTRHLKQKKCPALGTADEDSVQLLDSIDEIDLMTGNIPAVDREELFECPVPTCQYRARRVYDIQRHLTVHE